MNVQYHPGTGQQFYSTIPNLSNTMWSALPPRYMDLYAQNGLIKNIGSPNRGNNPSLLQGDYSADFTPNQYTARQLAELQSGSMGGGGNTIPMWMQQAYANKMGSMGAPANGPLPYQLTGSSFRGMPSGKAAPTGGQ